MLNTSDWCCCWNRESIQLLPKTPTAKQQLQQRCAWNDFNDGTSKIDAGPQLSGTFAKELFNSLQPTESANCAISDQNRVLDQNAPDDEDEERLLCLRPLPPVLSSTHCIARQSPDNTRINLFPEITDRYHLNSYILLDVSKFTLQFSAQITEEPDSHSSLGQLPILTIMWANDAV